MNSIKSIIIIPIAILLFSSCNNKKEVQQTKIETRNIPTVLVSNAVTHKFDASLQISGTAMANQQVKLFAMTSGFLNQLKVDIGDFVNKGQTLAVLENPELLSNKLKFEAELKGKKSIYERLKAIYEKTPQLTTIADVEKAEAEYTSIKAQRDDILTQIKYLNVKAPFSGVIVNRFVDKGAIIQSGLNNANAMQLFEIQDVQPIRLAVYVPETDAPLINKGTKTKIVFPELSNTSFSAAVSRIAYGLDESTKTMKIEIDLPNADLKIKPGMYAKVEIQKSGHKDALSVPNEAIGNVDGESFIWIAKNGVVKKVDVKIGIRDAKFSELLSGEIKSTDKIVVQGKQLCSDGATVKTKELPTK